MKFSLRRACVLCMILLYDHAVPPDEPVIEGSPEILLTAGVTYNLSCVSRGAKPPAVIEWQKDGLPVEGAVSTTVRHTHLHPFHSDRLYLDCHEAPTVHGNPGLFQN